MLEQFTKYLPYINDYCNELLAAKGLNYTNHGPIDTLDFTYARSRKTNPIRLNKDVFYWRPEDVPPGNYLLKAFLLQSILALNTKEKEVSTAKLSYDPAAQTISGTVNYARVHTKKKNVSIKMPSYVHADEVRLTINMSGKSYLVVGLTTSIKNGFIIPEDVRKAEKELEKHLKDILLPEMKALPGRVAFENFVFLVERDAIKGKKDMSFEVILTSTESIKKQPVTFHLNSTT